MKTQHNTKKIFLVVWALVLMGLFSLPAFAQHRRHDWRGRHEHVRHGHDRFDYYEGRYYRMSLFGAILDTILPPAGVTVTYLPAGYRTFYVGGVRYYEYDNVYYQPIPGGFVVVQQPVVTQYISPNVVYVPATNVSLPPQVQATGDRETITINVPRYNGGYNAITLVRYSNGFVGPKGEFYPTLPTGAQLSGEYGN